MPAYSQMMGDLSETDFNLVINILSLRGKSHIIEQFVRHCQNVFYSVTGRINGLLV